MRAAWTGSLSFGLVHIPVRLYSASEERTLNFKLLDKKDLSPISYQKVSKDDNEVLKKKDVVRGYELDGRYIVVTDEDFKQIDRRKVETMEIVQFAKESEISPLYYEKPYYIEPEGRSKKAYALFRDALQKSGKVAIVRYVVREKEHMGAIRTDGRVLMLLQLRYVDELRSPRPLNIPPKSGYTESELEVALALIESKSRTFDPQDFRDTYADELRRIISEKARGKRRRPREEKPIEATEVSEILAMLRRSLDNQSTFAR